MYFLKTWAKDDPIGFWFTVVFHLIFFGGLLITVIIYYF